MEISTTETEKLLSSATQLHLQTATPVAIHYSVFAQDGQATPPTVRAGRARLDASAPAEGGEGVELADEDLIRRDAEVRPGLRGAYAAFAENTVFFGHRLN